MFARRAVTPALTSRVLGVEGTYGGIELQTRQAASLKALKARMRSVENMKKITKAMKMVSAAKLKHDERRMVVSRPFVKPVMDLFGRLPQEEKTGTLTNLAITSDKGLCGGVNTAVARFTRNSTLEEEAKGNSAKMLVVGGKGIANLKRQFADRFNYSFEECTKLPWNFGAACIVAEQVIATKPQRLNIVKNKFISLMQYETTPCHTVTMHEAQTMDRAEWSKAMDVYSFEPALYEVMEDLHEFYYAAAIHGSVLETACCEQSSRMGAMENASKNATEMLDKIALIYNRARQAKITTELCEIISGASAV